MSSKGMLLPVLIVGLSIGLGAWVMPLPAMANGRFPGARQIAIHPLDPATLLLRTTFGQMLSHDSGQSFRWLCEEVIGYGGTQDPAVAITADGTLLNAAYEGTSVSHDGGCSFPFAVGLTSRYSLDLTLDTSSPAHALVIVAGDQLNGIPPQCWETTDNGQQWATLSDLDKGFFPQNVDVARSRPLRVYISGLQNKNGSSQASLLRSDDGGKTWAQREVSVDQAINVYLSAIDPQDEQRIYLRLEGSTEDELLLSTDGGESYQSLVKLPGGMLGFALSPDGTKIAVGGPTGGVLVASRDDGVFTQASPTPVTCLAWGKDGLYACGVDEIASGFAMARSTDEGKTFVPLLAALGDACGPLQTCGPTSPYAGLCPGRWPGIKGMLKSSGPPPVACDVVTGGQGGSGSGAAGTGTPAGAAGAGTAGAGVAGAAGVAETPPQAGRAGSNAGSGGLATAPPETAPGDGGCQSSSSGATCLSGVFLALAIAANRCRRQAKGAPSTRS